jgi:hypothetical protein
MGCTRINWEPLLDLHLKGTFDLGVIWIRFRRSGEVDSFYFIGEWKTKWPTGVKLSLEEAKEFAETLVDEVRFIQKISKKKS